MSKISSWTLEGTECLAQGLQNKGQATYCKIQKWGAYECRDDNLGLPALLEVGRGFGCEDLALPHRDHDTWPQIRSIPATCCA